MTEQASARWEPPTSIGRDALVAASERTLARREIPFAETEHVFRIEALGLEWDIGAMVYAPKDDASVPIGSDGRRIGFFLLHGGSSDHRAMAPLARLLTGKFGYRVASMTYPGRLNLADPSRDWPGDTIGPGDTIRTPIWREGEIITRDQVEIVEDASLRARYGIRTNARARPGTPFYERMAAWPAAFELGMKEVCRRFLPPDGFTIYAHGHSTGGPFVHLLTQRIANIAGIVGIENSPFAAIYQRMIGIAWDGPFNDLLLRTWRDIARYAGAEARHTEGDAALMRLPWLMEDVLERWERSRTRPNFKAEYIVHYAALPALAQAAQVAARRLRLSPRETDALVARYTGYTRELAGDSVKPVPPILLGIARNSRDHRWEVYRDVVLPGFAAMQPPPTVRVVRFDAGSHQYERPEPDLPMGLVPAVAALWRDTIDAGYFAPVSG